MKKLFNIGSLALLTSLFMASCGNSEQSNSSQVDHSAHTTETPAEAPATTSATTSTTSNTITVESNDQMQFNVNELHVKAGEPISLTLKHVGKMGKEVMGHNLIVLKAGADVAKFSEAALQAQETDYIPQSSDIVAHTDLIGGGEESKIEFTLDKPGTYDFICSFPGHASLMKGKIIAE
ncbi:azurin [Sphingobacterium daejeonense]|uniref:Azurin n=1 Tax=Sphingobacterium daejeonense TaxID=371142 RepID=A0ABW3RNX8_9SPHI|nr:azurin [Sphingobacterium daejeonense]MCT1533076.1 azurin [Sphingobacterium daejeonense]